MERKAEIRRKTNETDIFLELNLDGSGLCAVDCPVGFLRHMLAAFCRHGLFDLRGTIAGDLDVDQHHLVEDTGITLGEAFAATLGEKRGIRRAGFFLCPMDEALAQAAVDFGGRAFLHADLALSGIPLVSLTQDAQGSFQTDTTEDFWAGFTGGAKCNLHLDVLRGRSDHHKIEAVFKAAARAVREAVSPDPRAEGQIPSTKGVL